MNILLVEDDEHKASLIMEFFSTNMPHFIVNWKKSYQSGMKAMLTLEIDFILLDMSMPTFDRENSFGRLNTFRHYAGRDILEEMYRRDLKIPTIVVTQFGVFGEGTDAIDVNQLHVMLKEDFPETYLGLVYFNASFSNWKTELLSYFAEKAGK
ncbi:response regulator [Cohnella endophytica]|uniref:Response regulator n=1 Tax=Cohnella endophytica TaxID=2419778 RepID=A0A494XU17_9BACL|nr:response regulator [Cohnella endophytica]RKP54121.1 response regulator [Cohnella endophytica]